MSSPNVLVAIADGTEEIEFTTVVDVLRRAQIKVYSASVMPSCSVVCSRGIHIIADGPIADVDKHQWDMVVLPGGLPGANHLSESEALIDLIRHQQASDKWLAAICAAPAVVLGRHQLIDDHTATCYPSFIDDLKGCVKAVSNDSVVVDRKLVTSQGPGTAMAFALTLVKILCGEETYSQTKQALLA